MEINENLTKLIFREFDDSIKGTDIYNHEGSMWLIFTEERKWVVEFTKQKTLWYNYKHFNDILMLFGMELSEGAEYIKKWYEDKYIFNAVKPKNASTLYVDNVINNGVKETDKSYSNYRLCVEDTIQNGVKKVHNFEMDDEKVVEYTIQNGVKDTMINYADNVVNVEDTVQNGVKNTSGSRRFRESLVKDTIQNGVKKIDDSTKERLFFVEDTIENGVKHTEWNGSDLPTHKLEDTIQNGVKKISYHPKGSWSEYITYTSRVKDTIKNGVKDIIDGLYRPVEETIKNGVKEVEYYDGNAEGLVNDAIENGVKEVMDGNGQVFLVSEVIRKGVKRTSSRGPFSDGTVEDAVKYGVKIVDYHILESMEQKDHSVTTLDFTEKIKDTIENGVKEISSVDCEYPRATENVIKNGVKLKN